MKTSRSAESPDPQLWQRVIDFERKLSPSAARALLQIRFSAGDDKRMDQLLEKVRSGKLTVGEKKEMAAYKQLGCLLGILYSKARQALKKRAASA